MAGEQQQIVPYAHQVLPDYADTLEPGYRFCPTDAELIDYYLKRKIESGEPPRCRIYDVNVYDHHPEELKERYRSCEDKWYFFTKRESKYPTGTRVNRRTKKFGHWKSTQKDKPVYDSATRRDVGKKRSLAFHDDKDKKTPWLMQEYTYGGTHEANKVTEWVLCKIYKKEPTRSTLNNNNNNNNQMDEQVQSNRNNHDDDERPSPAQRRRLLVDQEANQPSVSLGRDHVEMMAGSNMFQLNHQSAALNINGTGSRLAIMMEMNMITQPILAPATAPAPEQVQVQFSSGCEYYQNHTNMSTSTLTNGFRGTSSSSSVCARLDCPVGDAHNQSMDGGANKDGDLFDQIVELLVLGDEDSQTLVNVEGSNNGSMNGATNEDGDVSFEDIMGFLGDGDEDSQTVVNVEGCNNGSIDGATNEDDDVSFEELMGLIGDGDEDSQTLVNVEGCDNGSTDAAANEDGDIFAEIMELLGDDDDDEGVICSI